MGSDTLPVTSAAANARHRVDVNCISFVIAFFFLVSIFMFLTTAPGVVYPFATSSFFSTSPSASASASTTTTSTSTSVELLHHMPPAISNGSVIKRSFLPIASGSYLYIAMGAYRGGANTFALVGLGSKSVQLFARPSFHCHWYPHDTTNASNSSVEVPGYAITPDWGMGRVYSVFVINCTFPTPVGADGSGGRLVVREVADGGGQPFEEHILALEEAPGDVNATILSAPPKYDYLYCGSPLFGDLSPQRVREWIAYHARLFGPRSHFVLFNAGGILHAVMDVLRPWIELGFVSIHDVRGQEHFDGIYHNQFLLINDCLFRHRLMANWIFYFDLDEFVYIKKNTTMSAVMKSLSHYTQVVFDQEIMSGILCPAEDVGRTPEMWGFEKLVYTRPPTTFHKDLDRKFAVQPRGTMSVAVHRSDTVDGPSYFDSDERIRYFHFHGTINDRRDPCREFGKGSEVSSHDSNFTRDDSLRELAGAVKDFERRTIGSILQNTRD